MNRLFGLAILILFLFLLVACSEQGSHSSKGLIYSDFYGIAKIAPGWRGEIIAKTNESYVGMDVEIGDADNDGENDILSVSAPNSRLYRFKRVDGQWQTDLLADNLASCYPCLGASVEVVDLNLDGNNEMIIGTGSMWQSSNMQRARFYLLEMISGKLTKNLAIQIKENTSRYTHGLAYGDIDNDGILEVVSSYCGYGEVIRYDVDKKISGINARKIHKVSGSGEGTLIADVDNDKKNELIVVNGFREGKAKVEIFEFDVSGELITPARISIDGFDKHKCFEASTVVGDVNNDGNNELIVAWKRGESINDATVIAYAIDERATPFLTFAYKDKNLDTGMFENAMEVADIDNDGKNELILSTRGEVQGLGGTMGSKLAKVFSYKVNFDKIEKELILDFYENVAWTSMLAVGDADNDGRNEVILATGRGNREKPGSSYVVLLEKE